MVPLLSILVFFFKKKTAYEMRISDWSSDVCSSDLVDGVHHVDQRADLDVDAGLLCHLAPRGRRDALAQTLPATGQRPLALARRLAATDQQDAVALEDDDADADERAVGIVVHDLVQVMYWPPLAVSVAPVMKPASSAARKIGRA